MNIDRYHDAMDHVSFDPALEDRVLSRVEEARAQPRRARCAPSRRRTLAVALAAALCLVATAGAVGRLSGLFAPRFGSHPEIVEQSGREVSACAASAGYTLTADALFGDQNCLYVAMTLTREDGGLIDSDGLFLHLEEVSLPGFRGGGYGAQVRPGQGKTDSVSLSASIVSYEKIAQGETLTLSFDRLARVDESPDAEPLAEGDWTLSFPVNCGDLTRSVALDAPIPVGDTGFTFDTLCLSPLSVWAVGSGVPGSDQELGQVLETLSGYDFSLILKDGTVIDLLQVDGDFRSRSVSHEGGGRYGMKLSTVFPDLIPLEDMASLTLCGQSIPLDLSGT